MSQTLTSPPAQKRPPFPPEEQSWKRYSSHGEMQISSAVSIAIHTFILLGFALGFWFAVFFPSTPPPVTMDLVEIEGASGGLDGLGESLANMGKGNQPNRTEGVGSSPV